MSNVPCPAPLTMDDCAKLNEILAHINGTGQLLSKCKNCGLPVEEQEAHNGAQQQLIENIKREFFPNQP